MKKPYHVTIDYFDDIESAGCWYKRKHIEQTMKRFRELGISRVYWLSNDDSMIPDRMADDSGSLTKAVVDAGHAEGLEVYALFKPFEMGLCFAVPHDFPLAEGIRTVSSQAGIHPFVESFVAVHPEMRLKKRSLYNTNRIPGMIKLVKADAEPTKLNEDKLEIWTSAINGAFQKYEGHFEFSDSLETRDGHDCRVLTFASLELPEDITFIMVRCSEHSDEPDFINKHDKIMEVYDRQGKLMPGNQDQGLLSLDKANAICSLPRTLNCLGLCKHNDKDYYLSGAENYGKSPEHAFFSFYDDFRRIDGERALDGNQDPFDGVIARSLMEKEYLWGALNPCYPKVRQYWLNRIQKCIDAGVDGVDIRLCNHSSWTLSGEDYGFNEPAVEAFKEKYGIDVLTDDFDMNCWKAFNHEYWMTFLREARTLTKAHSLPLQLHVPAYLGGKCKATLNNLLANFDWDWRCWITEDDLCDAIHLKWPHLDMDFTNEVAKFAKSHGKEVTFSLRLQYRKMDGKDNPELGNRLQWVQENDHIDAVVFYEKDCFTELDKVKDEVVLLPAMRELLGV